MQVIRFLLQMDLQQQITNLLALRDHAVHCEKNILQISNIAQSAQLNRSGRQGAAAFLAPSTSFEQYGFVLALPPLPQDLNLHQPPAPLPAYMAQGFEEPIYDEDEEICLLCCFLSQAEEAMREASGTSNPLICWGCRIPGHRFQDCPKQKDPQVLANARAKIQEWREKFVGRGYRNPDSFIPRAKLESDWKNLGFRSLSDVKNIITIISSSTSKKERKSAFENLASVDKKRAYVAAPTDPATPPTKNPRGTGLPKVDSNTSFLTFFSIPQEATSTVALLAPPRQELRRRPLSMTQTLPTIHLPVGDPEKKCTLAGLIDTCAGVCLGKLEYHMQVMKQFPGVAINFVQFSESQYREEYIGGINGGPPSVIISASIDYLLPYQVQGSSATIRVALSSQVATNTIFGLPFLKKGGFILNLQDNTVHASVFGDTYAITYCVPPQDEAPAIQEITQGVSLMGVTGKQE